MNINYLLRVISYLGVCGLWNGMLLIICILMVEEQMSFILDIIFVYMEIECFIQSNFSFILKRRLYSTCVNLFYLKIFKFIDMLWIPLLCVQLLFVIVGEMDHATLLIC